ncbi:helix-turn-helix transcriptional regulator [Propionibacterium freudenreichii]|uniref:helix-turn-helix transcriptional regulator n=1 Tax=Propionibacterium freudenreichii TaxID=1744 RepID=UPI001109D52F|nr:hypothetical protein [Propionibacterium freudenreichii]MDK9674318.1 hypothetical protein [Propionibacterium freudenreichii]
MTVDVELRVTGVDLDEEETDETLAKHFPDMVWEENSGLMTVTMFAEHDDLVSSVIEQVRRLEAALPSLKVLGVHRDLVSVTAIAHRVGLSREGVRKWTMEAGFPAPESVLEPGAVKVWPWSEVVDWVQRSRGVDLEDHVPTTQEAIQIDNCLTQNPDATTVQWENVQTGSPSTSFHESSRAMPVAALDTHWTTGATNETRVAMEYHVELVSSC